MISLKRVNFYIDERPILKDVSTDFEDALIHLIVGPTGAGKTTLLSLIIGFVKESSGDVIVPRGDISSLRKRMGILFQFPEEMFFMEKVYEEIALAPISRKMDRIENRVHKALEMVKLPSDILEASPYEISYGEKRRVALASILSFSPDWILLDEPLAGLDRSGEKMLIDVLNNLKGNGKGIIIASHRINNIVEIADTISLVVNGSLMFTSPVKSADWSEIFNAGCDVPISIKFAIEMASRGINIGSPITIEEAIGRLKDIKKEEI